MKQLSLVFALALIGLITLLYWLNRVAVDLALTEIFQATFVGLKILFFTGLVLGAIWCAIELRRRSRITVISGTKHRPAQAVIHKGELVQLAQPGQQIEPLQQLAMLKQVMAMQSQMQKFAQTNVQEVASGQALLGAPVSAKASNIITPDFPAERATFAEIFQRFTPTKERIFLLDTVNGPITGPLNGVTHVGLVGPTGGGKTITTRMLTAQFQYVGAKMYLASPNFAQLKLNNTYLEDWRPIVQHLAEPPAQTADEIDSLLKRFKALFEKRKAKEQSTPRRGVDLFLVLGEWPGIVARCPDAAEIIVLLLREARQYGIHLIFEFQDALVATLGVNSGARENIRHAYYYGGDIRTAKFALSLANGVKVDETGLGKNGAVYMRSLATDQILSGRVPLFNNKSLYMLLGTPPDPVGDDEITDESQIPETYYHVENGKYVEGSATLVKTEQEIDGNAQDSDFRPTQKRNQGSFGNVPYTQSEALETASHQQSGNVPAYRINELPEPVEHDTEDVPTAFIPRIEDKMLSEQQALLLKGFYKQVRNVEKSLQMIDNGQGKGLGARYRRHANWILDSEGLREAKEA